MFLATLMDLWRNGDCGRIVESCTKVQRKFRAERFNMI